MMEGQKTEHQKEMETFDVMAQDNEAVEAMAVAEYEETTPKRGEWWVCEDTNSNVENKMALYFNGNIWSNCEMMSLGAYSPLLITPLYRLEQSKLDKPKLKRAKEEFIEIDSCGRFWDLVKRFEEGVEFYTDGLESGKSKLGNVPALVRIIAMDEPLYRKVVTELTDREVFIEQGLKVLDQSKHSAMLETLGKLFDADCRFNSNLVGGK